jgi:membrane-bound inhibitor of C-type lysozyme
VKSIKRRLTNFNLIFCAVGLLLACVNPASHKDVTVEPLQQRDQSAAKTYVYECSDGYGFVARVEGEKAWLFLPRKTISLPHVPSGSGAKYSEDQITYWSKGDEALLEIGSDGVDFRAIGNEPGWNLEIIMRDRIVFVGNYGQNRYEFITTGPSIDQQARTTVYEIQNDTHEMSVIIVGRRCRDTMSGEAFETTVTVILDGKKYQGCGKALH